MKIVNLELFGVEVLENHSKSNRIIKRKRKRNICYRDVIETVSIITQNIKKYNSYSRKTEVQTETKVFIFGEHYERDEN